jgi:CheY-like chemotaxis protein
MPFSILAVHELRIVRTITQYILAEYSDASVDWFTSSLDASMILQKDKYDVILCGFDMPNMNGIAFQKNINASVNQNTPLIIMAATDNEAQFELLAEHGIKYVLGIPCTSLQLRETIDKVINPRSIRSFARYCIPDAKALLQFGDQQIQADVINISSGGVLCEFDCPKTPINLLTVHRMTIQFPADYGKSSATDIIPIILKLTVKSWNKDDSVHRVSIVFKFNRLPKEATDILESVFEKASQDLF